MSKSEILTELPGLDRDARREILERICDLDEAELTADEKAFLDSRLEECRRNPDAWSTWQDAKARILARLHQS